MSLGLYIFVLIELVAVTYLDLKYRTISNKWLAVNLIIFIYLLWSAPSDYQLQWHQFMTSAVILVVGFGLFLVNIMGGGDSKFLAGLFLLVPYELQSTFFQVLIFCTIVLALSRIAYKLIVKGKEVWLFISSGHGVLIKQFFGDKIPYAPIVLASWLYFGWAKLKVIG